MDPHRADPVLYFVRHSQSSAPTGGLSAVPKLLRLLTLTLIVSALAVAVPTISVLAGSPPSAIEGENAQAAATDAHSAPAAPGT